MLVLIDLFSRWPEICITQRVETCKVIEFLNEILDREGLPDFILTDNGMQLVSREMEEFFALRNIKHKLYFVYHPETSGMV